ncbi:hypothetical protein A3B51_00220 [Candidatus Curtissbacteria bacterium RIFCSPLOWO2_01_FULL_41_18]|uniref:Uncharacterized protein n=2 Tax=Candidatus Curtissiibacteriota TaxID=1752717 RepID=A0A1F5FZK3_9BACT|nr:MAG: hypothetical protein A2696_01755 [Candidatus Curtissbacteria bacterium RIFCSPHIGHO2_01_FULL_41_13]OGE04608.1 MAG: hypothetical protein A3B51_00220 [Candidatus Curtissbacteria bacterium RIFCSPLOWO2_01_FULL_41_18]
MRCGYFRLWHLGQVTRFGTLSLIVDFRLLVLDFACFFLGSAPMIKNQILNIKNKNLDTYVYETTNRFVVSRG